MRAVSAEKPPPRGRQAEARRNDARILEAALDVFARDISAPMSAVAHRAGVGQASLYRRYPSKETLLAEVSERGMTEMGAQARAALADADPGAAVAGFLHWLVESGTLRLSGLLGSFSPPERLFTLAREVNEALQALVDRAAAAGAIRDDITGADLTLVATQIGTLDTGDAERSGELRRRYLALALQGLALAGADTLPGPAPDAAELEAPWRALTGGQS
jgi:AcrR family transcriptional regulator